MSAASKTGQLGRNAAVYGGALLLPRLAAFVALIVFSRLLTPAEYGYFALFVISAELMNMVLFNWIRLAFLRLYAEHETQKQLPLLRRTCLAMTGLAMILSLPVALAMALLAAPDRWLVFFALLLSMNFANGIVRLRLSELQAEHRSSRYFAIEVSRAVLSLALSLALVGVTGPHFEALAIGFAAANVGVALVCLASFARDLMQLGLDRTLVRSIVSYAGPIIPITALESLIPLTERYVIQFVAGPAAVGVYAAAQNLVQQPINMLAAAVALAAFPIIMRSAEVDGHGGAQARMREVGSLLLALGVPAVAGIIMLRSEIATVILGEEFRADAIALMPWVAITAILVNLKFHYFDMAFHVTRRLMVQVATLLPATLLTAPLIYLFLQIWGLPGAAAGACIAFAASLAASWIAGRRLLTIPHAFGEMARILAATGVMIAVIWGIGPLPGLLGLIALIVAGGTAYVLTAVALNTLNMRAALTSHMGRLSGRLVGAS
ncbi:MAG: lipopolysaccharide biosynthesis protein [Methyloceanibacter sp.]|uniref:lipopolysaccharide biosynthesis protein n=1 Tax=Methyloceanibacter sp. TaxID=1965321 RepID=UPI003D6CAD5E